MEKIKERLYRWAMKSPLRKWALSLTGWKWWFYQIVVCTTIIQKMFVSITSTYFYSDSNDLIIQATVPNHDNHIVETP